MRDVQPWKALVAAVKQSDDFCFASSCMVAHQASGSEHPKRPSRDSASHFRGGDAPGGVCEGCVSVPPSCLPLLPLRAPRSPPRGEGLERVRAACGRGRRQAAGGSAQRPGSAGALACPSLRGRLQACVARPPALLRGCGLAPPACRFREKERGPGRAESRLHCPELDRKVSQAVSHRLGQEEPAQEPKPFL